MTGSWLDDKRKAMLPMSRYRVQHAGPNYYVRDTLTGETVFKSITRWEHEAVAMARRLNSAYDRFKAELPRPTVEPTNADHS